MASVVSKYYDLLDKHDGEGIRALAAPGAKIDLGGMELDFAGDYITALEEVWASVPDMKFSVEDITEGENGVFHVKGCEYWGTHTGDPYGFGPYPKITASGAKCFSDKETMEVVVENDKITFARIIVVEGKLNGPPRFYTQMGGTLDAA